MDVKYINPFISSVTSTLETMCGLKVTPGKPELKVEGKPKSDVSAVIGYSGGAKGSVVLHMNFDTASKIASAFACDEITSDPNPTPEPRNPLDSFEISNM